MGEGVERAAYRRLGKWWKLDLEGSLGIQRLSS